MNVNLQKFIYLLGRIYTVALPLFVMGCFFYVKVIVFIILLISIIKDMLDVKKYKLLIKGIDVFSTFDHKWSSLTIGLMTIIMIMLLPSSIFLFETSFFLFGGFLDFILDAFQDYQNLKNKENS